MSVLFVDDDPLTLRDLEHLLALADVDWDCEFALGGDDAIALMSGSRFDAVVTDMRMEGMDGAQLLNYVSAHYPETVRIVLSKPSDRDAVLRSIVSMHQFLPKPCDALALKTTIDRARSLRDLLVSDSLQRLVGGLSHLPSVPAVYRQLTRELRNEDASISSIGEIVAQDAAMTAKVLQLVNSQFTACDIVFPTPSKPSRRWAPRHSSRSFWRSGFFKNSSNTARPSFLPTH